MKKTIIFLLASVSFFNCSERKGTIDFSTLKETEFNVKRFEIPTGKISDSLKQAHDNCMGFSFDANAMLVQTKDSFFIGSIVNRQSLKIVNTINGLGLSRDELIAEFNVISNPCYEKRVLHFPLRSILGKNFILQFPNAGESLNKELNNAVSASRDAEMQTGSWVYLDMKDALKKILDTTQNPDGLHYREDMLDTSNMVLTAAESITDISFIINTQNNISEPLQTFLKNKPSVLSPDLHSSIQLFYIDNNKFQITLSGFFPVVGKFMKARLQ